MPVFGIRRITGADVADAAAMGRVFKLMALARREGDSLCCTVEPVLVGNQSLEAAVPLNYNLACIEAPSVGALKFYGQGAGSLPTANAVVQDLLDIESGGRGRPRSGKALHSDLSLLKGRWWLRVREEAAQAACEALGSDIQETCRAPGRVTLETGELPASRFYPLRDRLLQLDDSLFAARFLD